MDDQVSRLVDIVWAKYQQLPPKQRLLIAIGGIPGSGKTTLAQAVADGVNRRHKASAPPGTEAPPPAAAENEQTASAGVSARASAAGPAAAAAAADADANASLAIAVPMDGFHLTRAQLSAMADPARAHARRGAEFTFDGAAFLRLVQRLREAIADGDGDDRGRDSRMVFCPSFDHAVKDPVADAIAIGPRQRVVLFEGNYVVLDRPPWRQAAALMDQRWFVDVAFDVARARLVRRHVATGVAADSESAGRRADENDLVNGREIVDNLVADVDERIASREDASWSA